jgi:hypothetical protein
LWKNGGGSTRTLAVHPPDATLDDFLWRVSLAEVSSPGEFSLFPGIDRTILVWSGSGLVLRAPDWSFELQQPFLPFSFEGEDTIDCELIAGPTIDLNVMVRRGAGVAALQVARETVILTEPSEVTFLLCAVGNVQVHAGPTVKAGEFVRIDHCEPGTLLTSSPGEVTFLLISISLQQYHAESKERFRNSM